MLRYLLIVFLLVLFQVHNIYAQELSWNDFVERMTSDEEGEYASWEYLYEELVERHENPFNIQTLKREELETLPFLSDKQIENLLAYLYTYGPMISLSELQLVEGLDYETRRLLSLFVYVGEAENSPSKLSWRNIAHYGNHELTARADIPLYYRKGYYKYSQSVLDKYPNRRYLGDPVYHSLRYKFSYGSRITAGFTAEKDAGEPFFKQGNLGYDAYSFYIFLRNVWKFETLAVGDYQLSFGQGLVMNTRFSLGKQSVLTSLSSTKGIRQHSSTSETGYFRGLAASVRLGRWFYTGFYSFKQEDATVENGLITSLKTDGYHRTLSEMSKKHTYVNQLIGNNLTYKQANFQFGLTAVYNFFNKELIASERAYKRYDPTGKHFYAVGADYRYDVGQFSFSGETAWSQGGGMATLNLLRYRFSSSFRMLALYRYYAKDYGALYANSFEEGGYIRNEHGFYLGLETSPFDLFQLTAYVDFFRFPYMKYRLSTNGSQGMEGMLQLTNQPYRKFVWTVRYQYKSRGEDFTTSDERKGVSARTTQKLKLQGTFYPIPILRSKTTIYGVITNFITTGNQYGLLISEALSYTFANGKCQAELGGAYFDTDSYAARVYGYERGMLYSFTSSSFYGQGVRGYAWVRYDMNKLLTCLVKYGHTEYFDRNTISSGTQEIESSRKQDFYLQFRLKF